MNFTVKRRIGLGAGLLLVGAAVGAAVQRASAEGVPVTTPLFYSGTLVDNGAPVNGPRALTIYLWSSPTDTTSASNKCSTVLTAVMISNGKFRVPLDASCTAAVHGFPELWVEVLVGATSLGRKKLGATPYALQAGRASEAVGNLRKELDALKAQSVPAGAISMFAGACPAGWSEVTALRGRVPRGEPAGNAASLDNGGSDDAVVAAHTHAVAGRTGHVDTIESFRNVQIGGGPAVGRNHFAAWTGGPFMQVDDVANYPAAGHTHSFNVTSASAGESAAGKNMQAFREVIFCVKS